VAAVSEAISIETGSGDHLPEADGAVSAIAAGLAGLYGWAADQEIRFRPTPTARTGIGMPELARRLLDCARRSSPQAATSLFVSFFGANARVTLDVLVLWGFEPVEPTPLSDAVTLQPLSSLRRSEIMQLLLPTDEPYLPLAIIPHPRAALIRRFVHAPVIDPPLPGIGQPPTPENENATEMLLEVARVLAAVVEPPVSPVGHWYQAEDAFSVLPDSGGAEGYEVNRQFLFAGPRIDVEALGARPLVEQYLALGAHTLAALRVPLDRLNSAKLHLHAGHLADCALDLGIALDALLCPETNTEITYRLAIRGAVLRGGDAQQRRDTYDLLRCLYEARSAVAHGDTTRALRRRRGSPKITVAELLPEAVPLASELLRIVIARGAIPDWEALVIGGAVEPEAEDSNDVAGPTE
jgi:hypothetical protein